MQRYDSNTTASEASLQAPVGRVNGHSILGGGGGGGQLQTNPIPTRASWQQTTPSSSADMGYGSATSTAGTGYDDEQQQQNVAAVGLPTAGTPGQQGYSNDLQSAGRMGTLANTVKALRAATAAAPGGTGVSNSFSAIAPEDLEIQVPTSAGLSSSSKEHPGVAAAVGTAAPGSSEGTAATNAAGGAIMLPPTVSTGTEYHDADRSRASWDLQDIAVSDEGVMPGAKQL